MRSHTTIFLLIVCMFWCNFSNGQELVTVRDIGTRTGVGWEHEFGKDFEFSIFEEIRLRSNSSELDELITDFGLSYQINKEFSIASNVRYILNRHDNKVLTNDVRYNVDFNYKRKFARNFRFKYRLRYQQRQENALYLLKYEDHDLVSKFRNRVAIELKADKHTYFISGEIFRANKLYRSAYFDKARFYLGDEFEYNNWDIKLALGYEHSLDQSLPLRFYFLRTTLKLKK